MRLHVLSILLLGAMLLLAPHSLQAQTHAFEGATIYPIEGDRIDDGTLVISDGEIQEVGASDAVSIPGNAEVHDASGQVIMPGLVDTHSHIGGVQGGDGSAPMHSDVRSLDAIDVRDPSLWRARSGGITTVNVMPGSGHLLSGQTTYLKTRHGEQLEDLLLCDDPINDICGGMKMANGTNSIRANPTFPGTRARSAAIVRQKFLEAQEYQQQLEDGEEPSRDLELETLVDVMNGDRIVHFHTHRHDDILTAIRIGEEFGFDPVLHHVSEGWRVADQIAEAGVPASIIVLDAPGGKHEASKLYYKTGAALEDAGADVSYHTDDYITDSRLFLRSAAFGVRAGMSRDAALEAMTMAGARQLGLEDQIGSLEPGKDADFIILSGDPLSVYTHVEATWIDGERVFNRENPEHRDYSTGGYGVYTRSTNHLH